MRKLSLLAVALAAAISASTARALPVEVVFAPTAPTADTPEGLFPWSLSLNLEEGVELLAIQFMVTGFEAMAVNLENPGIDPLDSVFRPGLFGDDRSPLIIVAKWGPDEAIGRGPAAGLLLATLYSPVDCVTTPASCPVQVLDHPEYLGGAVMDVNFELLTEYAVFASPGSYLTGPDAYPDLPPTGGSGGSGSGGGGSGGGTGGDPGVPEPGGLALVSLALLTVIATRARGALPGRESSDSRRRRHARTCLASATRPAPRSRC